MECRGGDTRKLRVHMKVYTCHSKARNSSWAIGFLIWKIEASILDSLFFIFNLSLAVDTLSVSRILVFIKVD